jgi:uncharacterized coiled-coil DUF342 family protein
MREYIEELEAHARRLERQRDELMDKTVDALARVGVLTEAADYLNGRLREVTAQRDELLEALEALLQHRPRADWEGLTIAEGLTWDDAEDLIAAVKGGTP